MENIRDYSKKDLYDLCLDENSKFGQMFVDFINNETPYDEAGDNSGWWNEDIFYTYDDMLDNEFDNFYDSFDEL